MIIIKIKSFKKWLVDNELDEEELFIEAVKCFQIEAYKASYLLSYLGFIKSINSKIIEYKGIPKNFQRLSTNAKDRKYKWSEKIKLLKSTDDWDTETIKFIDEKRDNNIFLIGDDSDFKKEFSYFKSLRNVVAHNKRRIIDYSTVLELWDMIMSYFDIFIIGGQGEEIVDELNKLIIYEDDEELIKQEINSILEKYFKLNIKNQSTVINLIENRIIELIETLKFDDKYLDFIDYFLEEISLKKQFDDNWISDNRFRVYCLVTNRYFEYKGKIATIKSEIYSNLEVYSKIITIMGLPNPGLKFISSIYLSKESENWKKLVEKIVSYEFIELDEKTKNVLGKVYRKKDIELKIEKFIQNYSLLGCEVRGRIRRTPRLIELRKIEKKIYIYNLLTKNGVFENDEKYKSLKNKILSFKKAEYDQPGFDLEEVGNIFQNIFESFE